MRERVVPLPEPRLWDDSSPRSTHDATHRKLVDSFGVGNLRSIKHLGLIFRKGRVVNSRGEDVYLEHPERLAIPIHFLVGESNTMFFRTRRTKRFIGSEGVTTRRRSTPSRSSRTTPTWTASSARTRLRKSSPTSSNTSTRIRRRRDRRSPETACRYCSRCSMPRRSSSRIVAIACSCSCVACGWSPGPPRAVSASESPSIFSSGCGTRPTRCSARWWRSARSSSASR
jgi:hypothetical protein